MKKCCVEQPKGLFIKEFLAGTPQRGAVKEVKNRIAWKYPLQRPCFRGFARVE